LITLIEINNETHYVTKKKTKKRPDTSAFNADVKEKNTKTNKITIVKNHNLATQNYLFNMYIPDVWRWPNPVKTLNVPFLLQNPQWNQRMNSHEPCI
jgi:hypothetical protein